jgi:hypothetical protein
MLGNKKNSYKTLVYHEGINQERVLLQVTIKIHQGDRPVALLPKEFILEICFLK